MCGPGSSVGIASDYGLDGAGSNPSEATLPPVQTGPGTHPASYTMGTGSFAGVKRPGRGVDNPPTFSAELKKGVELYLYFTSGTIVEGYRSILPLPLPLLTTNTPTDIRQTQHLFVKHRCYMLGSCRAILRM